MNTTSPAIPASAPGFEDLWHGHQAFIVAFCTRRLRSRDAAQDVSQNVFLKAHRNLATFEGRAQMRTWLAAIAVRECIDYQRSEARHAAIVMREAAGTFEPGQEAAPEELAIAEASRQQVASTLQALPKAAREVLYLRFFRDLPLDEVAAALGLRLSATKMRLYRALERLAASYGCLDNPTVAVRA